MIEQQPSCDDPRDTALMPGAEARARMAAAVRGIDIDAPGASETLALDRLRDRVLAEAIVSPANVPPARNAAMDGYAIHADSVPDAGETTLRVIGRALAGERFSGLVNAGEAVRIFTGAEMPDGADTVVIQEHAAVVGENEVRIDSRAVPGKNVRAAGEDVALGEALFAPGRVLNAADIGVLASLGIRRCRVVRPLRVAVFTTGDELVTLTAHPEGTPLPPGKLFDSNRHVLAALLDSPAVELIDLGVVADTAEATLAAMQEGSERADLVLSSGGVSTGDADFVGRSLAAIGDVGFWRIAMRPGRPLAFGHVGDAVFFGLPGNPVAVMVTFLQFVRPAIAALLGSPYLPAPVFPATAESSLRKTPGRVEYQRGIMRIDEHGKVLVRSTGKQGAGRLSSMSLANCLIVIDAEVAAVAAGDRVGVQPFDGLLRGLP